MRSFYSFTTNPLEPLWLTSNWKIIFTTAALLCGMVFRENLSSPSYYPGLASFPFTLWIHLCLSGDDIWFSLLWCGDDISLGKGKRMKCLHLSTYIFPSFSISIFPSPSSCPSTSHLPSPSFQLVVEDSPVHTMKIPSRPSERTQLNAIDLLFGQRTSCQSGRLVARGRENDREGDMWTGKAMVLFIWVRTRHPNHSHDNYLTTFSPNIYLGSNTEQASWFQIQFQPRKRF